jgi:hypothetical protein
MTNDKNNILRPGEHRGRIIQAVKDFFNSYEVPSKNRHKAAETNNEHFENPIKKAGIGVHQQENGK